jgi:hypothetical protein
MGAEHAGMDEHDVDALVGAARMAANAPSTGCLVVFTTLGGTARRMARERPLKPILVLTPNPNTARRLALVWGLEPRLGEQPDSLEAVTDDAVNSAVQIWSGRAGPAHPDPGGHTVRGAGRGQSAAPGPRSGSDVEGPQEELGRASGDVKDRALLITRFPVVLGRWPI